MPYFGPGLRSSGSLALAPRTFGFGSSRLRCNKGTILTSNTWLPFASIVSSILRGTSAWVFPKAPTNTGHAACESRAICFYIDQVFSGPPLVSAQTGIALLALPHT